LYYKQQFIQEDLTSNPECVLPRIYILGIVTNRESGSGFGAGYGVTKDFIESFLCTDGLPISLSRYILAMTLCGWKWLIGIPD